MFCNKLPCRCPVSLRRPAGFQVRPSEASPCSGRRSPGGGSREGGRATSRNTAGSTSPPPR
eukprot:5689918-Pyramimonas_sp.AAC.2